jgi:hypothetical protein
MAAELGDFATAALQQGRAQFRSGTEREVIDAVPNEPAQQQPAKAEITEATGGAGTAHLVFGASHATSFDVFQKKAGQPAFTKVADDIIETTYNATGLLAAEYSFKVVGRNSLGVGPESDVSVVVVT